MNPTKLILAIALSGTISSTALAGPPPMTEAELFEMADVVADIETVSLSCNGTPVESEYETRTSYSAELQPIEVLKGAPGDMIDYSVTSTEYNDELGLPGCSSPEYVLPQGWVGRVYLTARPNGGYAITEWGGAVKDHEASITHEVPTCDVISPEIGDPDPEDPNDPSDPTDPSDPDTSASDEEHATPVAGCSMSPSGTSTDLGLMLGLALAFAGLRRRSS